MAHVLAVANQKGGVGKSTTVLNLGAALAERGQRVLLLDLDPQAALTASIGLDPYKVQPSTFELLLQDNTSWRDVVHPVGTGMWLAPASVRLSAAEFKLAHVEDRAKQLRQALQSGKPIVDYILIDTPPSLGLLTVNALMASDGLIVPVECQYLALRGVRAVVETTRLLQDQLNAEVELVGFLLTMTREESGHCRSVANELRRVFRDQVFDSEIVFDDAVAMAPAERQPVLGYSPGSPASASYRTLADEIMHRMGG